MWSVKDTISSKGIKNPLENTRVTLTIRTLISRSIDPPYQTFLPITYDYSTLLASANEPPFAQQTGLTEADLKWLAPRLEAVRKEVLADGELFRKGGPIPAEKQPLDAAFFDLPEKFLGPDRKTLDAILATADRLAKEVDRVLVLGIGGSYMGARALMEGCCHPYHNELARKRRGGRPRMYFEGNNVDNDAVQALLDLVEGDDDWAIIVISKSGGTLETAVAFRVFFEALKKSCKGDEEKLRRRIVPITGENGQAPRFGQGHRLPDGLSHSRRRGRKIFDLERRGTSARRGAGHRHRPPARRRRGDEREFPHGRAAGKSRAWPTRASPG